jgi:cytochrome c biogenesis protein CcmG, thiol:disulfide interchange protein DsbE
MKKLILLLGIAIMGLTFNAKAQPESKQETAEFPSIVLKDLEGKDVDLKKLTQEGKVTIISFWATWCSPCKKELENMTDLIKGWEKDYNVQLIAISIDDARNAMKVKPYVDGKNWKFKVLLDVNSDTRRNLNFSNVPYTLLVDKTGKIVFRHTGYSEGDEFVLEEQIKKLK